MAKFFRDRPAKEPRIAVLAAKGLNENGGQQDPLHNALLDGAMIQQTTAIWTRNGHGIGLDSLPAVVNVLTVTIRTEPCQ